MEYPALELVWSPTGTGAVLRGHAWPVGEAQPVGDKGLTFGSVADVRVAGVSAREHCTIERRGPLLKLWHQERVSRSLVNGVEVKEAELHHRDLVALPRGALFRVLERPEVSARSKTLEDAVASSPGDREVLQVWRDFLLDHGDPLGERMGRAKAGDFANDAQWLDALAMHYETGRLQVGWRSGLAEKVTLREPTLGFHRVDLALEHLFSLPVMRFVRDVTLDVASDKVAVATALKAFDDVGVPKSVRRLSLGDQPESERERVTALLAGQARPVELGFFSEAQLEIVEAAPEVDQKVGQKVGVGEHLTLGRAELSPMMNVLLGGSYLVRRDGPRFVLERVVSLAKLAKVNGKPVDRFPLRDGDVIELSEDLTARFRLVR